MFKLLECDYILKPDIDDDGDLESNIEIDT